MSGEAVTDVARAERVPHLRLGISSELAREDRGYFADGDRAPGADIHDLAVGRVWPERCDDRLRDVRDMDEVAALHPVFVDHGRRPASKRDEKIAATPVYGFESACRGP